MAIVIHEKGQIERNIKITLKFHDYCQLYIVTSDLQWLTDVFLLFYHEKIKIPPKWSNLPEVNEYLPCVEVDYRALSWVLHLFH